jgi:hypothetical protein
MGARENPPPGLIAHVATDTARAQVKGKGGTSTVGLHYDSVAGWGWVGTHQ